MLLIVLRVLCRINGRVVDLVYSILYYGYALFSAFGAPHMAKWLLAA